MELVCFESSSEVRSAPDNALRRNTNVLANMLSGEEQYMVCNSWRGPCCHKGDVTPAMRKILTTWMLEVCEEQRCEDAVFLLAVNILDRFVNNVTLVQKGQLQLLGTTCLLIASKIRQCRVFTSEQLCYYTDHSVNPDELLSWELLVLGRLRWKMSAIVSSDFMDSFINKMPPMEANDRIRHHAHALLVLCATEIAFTDYRPSLVAASCLCVAVKQLNVKTCLLDTIVSTFRDCTCHSVDAIYNCMSEIEGLVNIPNVQLSHSTNQNTSSKTPAMSNHSKSASSTPTPQDIAQPETPTDIQDVHF